MELWIMFSTLFILLPVSYCHKQNLILWECCNLDLGLFWSTCLTTEHMPLTPWCTHFTIHWIYLSVHGQWAGTIESVLESQCSSVIFLKSLVLKNKNDDDVFLWNICHLCMECLFHRSVFSCTFLSNKCRNCRLVSLQRMISLLGCWHSSCACCNSRCAVIIRLMLGFPFICFIHKCVNWPGCKASMAQSNKMLVSTAAVIFQHQQQQLFLTDFWHVSQMSCFAEDAILCKVINIS